MTGKSAQAKAKEIAAPKAAAPKPRVAKAPVKAAKSRVSGTEPARWAAELLCAADWQGARRAFFALAERKAGDEAAARIFALVRARVLRMPDKSELAVLEVLLLGMVKLQNVAAAHAVFDRLIEVAPEDANLPYRKALLHYRTGEVAQAIALWETLRGRTAKPQELLKMLTQAYMLQRQPDKAADCARAAIEAAPRDAEAHSLLGKALMTQKDHPAASQAFRQALLRDAQQRDSFSGLIATYGKDDKMKEAEKAAHFFVRRFPSYIAPSAQSGVRVLLLEHTSRMLLTDARYGRKAYAVNNMVSMMSDGRLAFNHLYVDLTADPLAEALRIPPCDVIFNNAANAELLLANKGFMLQRVKSICRSLDLPVINPVETVIETTRRRNYERFHDFPGIVFPKTIKLTFDAGREDEVVRLIGEAVPFPLILRQSFTHADTETDRVRDEKELRAVLPKYAGKQAYIIQYIDCSDAEGIFRRYRAMFIGDRVFPSSVLASQGWNVHASSSLDLMDSTERLKEEERRYQSDMESVIGKEAVDTFWRIRDKVGLDYFGIDYNFDREGRLVVFEINPSMNLALRDHGDFAYIEQSNAGIKRAMEDLMIERAHSTRVVPEAVRRLFA